MQLSPAIKEAPWIIGNAAEKFWGELYQLEDYKSGSAQKELEKGWINCRYEGTKGKYCNVKGGKRVTYYQPNEYIGTIYFLGPCIMFGAYTEDKYTIESYLQKKLLEKGYSYRVENYASPLRFDSEIDDRLREINIYNKNDIVVYLSQSGEVAGVPNCSLWEIYERHQVSTDWITNYFLHCNNKVNQIIADNLFEFLKPSLLKRKVQESNFQIDFYSAMKKYVFDAYLVKYFNCFLEKKYHTIGAIVMNCNPFTKGHKYLIEQASQHVELLIVFVVEENESFFSFEERIRMVTDGTKDIANVMIVPSGEFILSKNNFAEYFTKEEDEIKMVKLNAEYDIRIFADYIADPLHITHRFAGEEPADRVTQIYNAAMKKILPQKAISFIEIPRLMIQNEIVSASKVREYLRRGEYDKAAGLLPETTISFLLE